MPLQKLQLRPGLNREGTDYANEGGWYDGNNIRFRSGFPEKLGGWIRLSNAFFLGIARSLWNWATLNGSNLLGVGTNLNWGYTTSSTPVAGTNGSIGTNGSVFTGTATWSNRPGSPFLFAVSSTVPEPSTYMFGATSILILAFTKKRRKNIERRLTGSV